MRPLAALLLALAFAPQEKVTPGWTQVSLEAPNSGKEQTSATVFDIDRDGVNDFVITERTQAPAVVWYRRHQTGWTRHVLEADPLRPEAGSTFGDIDNDGDLDFIAGGDGRSNEVWWWENPHPNHDPAKRWTRYSIKRSGRRKHHDQLWTDVDGDGKPELLFWNQGDNQLMLARPPAAPRTHRGEWPMSVIFSYSNDSEMLQRASSPPFKGVNEHEGLWMTDVDGDGKKDILAGGYWFKHAGGDRFVAHTVDAGYHFSRSAGGDVIEGGRHEVVLVVGDGVGPLMLYEWTKGTWRPKVLLDSVDNGHSLEVLDFNRDGHLDIFCAEMRLNSGNEDAKIRILLGDGKGGFRTTIVAEGFDSHESKLADLDGDGDLDVLAKPYNHGTPSLNLFLNGGR